MLKKSAFFEFLSRHQRADFEEFIGASTLDEHYIVWR